MSSVFVQLYGHVPEHDRYGIPAGLKAVGEAFYHQTEAAELLLSWETHWEEKRDLAWQASYWRRTLLTKRFKKPGAPHPGRSQAGAGSVAAVLSRSRAGRALCFAAGKGQAEAPLEGLRFACRRIGATTDTGTERCAGQSGTPGNTTCACYLSR